tara:strand:- start:551 stop:1798 length:1248 start_codon:yes stop_codon:yes gene_type:complete
MANGNQSGFGTPGTQRTAQKNVQTGGINPNMPVGQQLAKQGASAYQRSLTTGGASPGVNLAKAAYTAPAPQLAKPSPLAGFPYKESLGMNASLGFSNEAIGLGPREGGGGYQIPSGGAMPTQGAGPSPGKLYSPATGVWSPHSGQGTTGTSPSGRYVIDNRAGSDTQGKVIPVEDYSGEVPDQYTPGEITPSGTTEDAEVAKEVVSTEEAEKQYEEIYGGDSPLDVTGIDPDEYAKIEQTLTDNAEFAYQQGIGTISRQYAMMGMTGSGAHMVANNALMADIADQLLREQSALAMANQQQVELDLAEKFDQAVKLANTMASTALSGAQIDQIDVASSVAFLEGINTELGGLATQFWSLMGKTPNGQMVSAYAWILAEVQADGDIPLAVQRLSDLLAGKFPEDFPMGTGFPKGGLG